MDLKIMLYAVLSISIIVPFVTWLIVKVIKPSGRNKFNFYFGFGFILAFVFLFIKTFSNRIYYSFVYKYDLIRADALIGPFYDYLTTALIILLLFIIIFSIKKFLSKKKLPSVYVDDYHNTVLVGCGIASGIFMIKVAVSALIDLNWVCSWGIYTRHEYYIGRSFIGHPFHTMYNIPLALSTIIYALTDAVLICVIVILAKEYIETKNAKCILVAFLFALALYVMETILFLLHVTSITFIFDIVYLIFVIIFAKKHYKRLSDNLKK